VFLIREIENMKVPWRGSTVNKLQNPPVFPMDLYS
jgi:hypothetical protein